MSRTTRVFLVFLAVLTGIRFFYAAFLGLGDDEAYGWEWGRRLDWSYLDHPPMIAWIGRLACALFGDHEWSFRLGAIVCGSLFTVLLFLLSTKIFARERTALRATLFLSAIPIYFATSIMMLPDAPLSVFWAAALLCFYQITATGNPIYWRWLGVCFGLGMLSKYNMIMLPVCVLVYLALVKEHRFWLVRKEPYLAALVAALLFSPVMIWNASRGFPSLAFHLVERNKAGLSWLGLPICLAGQLGFVSPLAFVGAVYGMIRSGARAIHGRDRLHAFLFSFSFPYLFVFWAACTLSPTAKQHWPALGYIPALLSMAMIVETPEAGGTARRRGKNGRVFFGLAFATSACLTLLLLVQSTYPIFRIKPTHDLTNELYGWPEVAKAIDEQMQELQKTGKAVVVASRWAMASQVAFYTRDRYDVYSVNPHQEQHDLWNRGSLDGLAGRNALFVSDNRYAADLTNDYSFERVERLAPIEIKRAGRVVRQFNLVRCYNLRGKANASRGIDHVDISHFGISAK